MLLFPILVNEMIHYCCSNYVLWPCVIFIISKMINVFFCNFDLFRKRCYIRLIEERGELFYCLTSDKNFEICTVDPNRPRFSFVVSILLA